MVSKYSVFIRVSAFSMASGKKQVVASSFQEKASKNDIKLNDVFI
jgi:hypothetical protein